MKKVFVITVLFAAFNSVFAQDQVENIEVTPEDIELESHTIGKYRLFKTTNRWTFIKLDTQNGRMWQVQYDTGDNARFTNTLSSTRLVDIEKEVNNRFTLYPTQNMWTFILLDQLDGRTWQVQWSHKANERLVWAIY